MYILIGLVVVLASIIIGYMMEGGDFHMLAQPAEYIIILGCALGAFFGSQTKYTWKLWRSCMRCSPRCTAKG
jgi:chemotaxis protein MotA